MPRKIDHAHKKIEIYLARKNLVRENLDLRKRLADVEWTTEQRYAQRYAAILRAKDEEIARLMAINRAERDARATLDLYLQKWILENPEVNHE